MQISDAKFFNSSEKPGRCQDIVVSLLAYHQIPIPVSKYIYIIVILLS